MWKERPYEEGLLIRSETKVECHQQEGQERQGSHHLQGSNQTPQEDDQRGARQRRTNQGDQHHRIPTIHKDVTVPTQDQQDMTSPHANQESSSHTSKLSS